MTLEATLEGSGPDLTEGYASEPRPLKGYALLGSLFGAGFAGFVIAAHRRGRMPERIEARDLVLLGIATHKISRLAAKEMVTSFVRAPFTRFEEETGKGEVSERSRGQGLRRATGELLTCPCCVGQWVAAGLTAGLVSPRAPHA